MRKLKKILYFILLLFALLCGLIIACAFHPELTASIADFLNLDRTEIPVTSEEMIPEAEGNSLVSKQSEVQPNNDGNTETDRITRDGMANDSGKEGIADDIASEYLPPSQSELVIPQNVSGKNGYQEIQDAREQLDEDEAYKCQEQLDYGNTGDGLLFDAVYYPYYAMLDEKGKHLYRQIYANANDRYPVFAPVESATAGELKNIFSAVYNDHPELFWVETAYAGKYRRNGKCVEIDLKFNRTVHNLERAKADFEERAGQILSDAQKLPTDYEKERYVHDTLIDWISYDLGAEMNQSAYSALVNGQTVCAGYARAFQYLLMQLGIPCYYCTGFAGESHAWNIVSLEDGYYNVDTTWDDTGNGTYDYFNKTDADYSEHHIRKNLSVYLPPCDGQNYRNLEQSEQENGLRSLEDTGMTEAQVFTSMQDYYADCYDKVVQNGTGSYIFYNVLEGEELLDEWHQNYGNENYRRAYLENAMTDVGASSCEMELDVEALQGDRYLITHRVSIQ